MMIYKAAIQGSSSFYLNNKYEMPLSTLRSVYPPISHSWIDIPGNDFLLYKEPCIACFLARSL